MRRTRNRRIEPFLLLMMFLVQTNFVFSQAEKLDAIRAAIKERGAQWTPKESWVSRLSFEEFQKLLGARDPELEITKPISPPLVLSYPEAIDWRNKDGHNWVTSVKNQENCRSCVAFGAVATLESLVRIELYQPDKNIDLSEMDVFHCGCGNCCAIGWNNYGACYYLNSSGAPDEGCWPYQPVDQFCSYTCYNWQGRAVRIANAAYISGQDNCKTCVATAPILGEMAVYEDFSSYGDGIYQHVWGNLAGYHSVCIVGYDTTGTLDYWIVKNSWGDGWGEDGFFRIKMGECGIETIANYWMSGVILPAVPAAPSSLAANAIKDTQVNVTWHDNSNNEGAFEIQRKEEGGTFSTVISVAGDTTSYQDHTVCGDTTYYYRVRAYNVGGNSGFSNIASDTTPPKAPSNLDATTLSSSSIRVIWTDNSSTENGFEIWQKQGSGSWQLNSTVGANITSKDITGLQEGTTYSYRVRAYNSYGNSDWSNTDSSNTPPRAPSNLNATTLSSVSIRVVWTDNSSTESGFEIWQKQGSGSWQLNSTVGANVSSKDITGLQPGTTYCYRVRAYSSYGNSDWSNTDCDTTQAGVPAAPTNLQTYGYCFEVKLTWQDNSNNESGFWIYRKSGDQYYQFDYVGPNVTTYWDIDLPCGQLWCYKVQAYNQNGNSPFSNSSCAKTTYCYDCEGGLSMKIGADPREVSAGGNVIYTYILENRGKFDLTDIELRDDRFGIIGNGIALTKGETRKITKIATLNETVTNFAEASAAYYVKDETKFVKAHACVTVKVINSSED